MILKRVRLLNSGDTTLHSLCHVCVEMKYGLSCSHIKKANLEVSIVLNNSNEFSAEYKNMIQIRFYKIVIF